MSMYVTTHTLYTIHAVTAVGGDNAEGHTYKVTHTCPLHRQVQLCV